MTCLNELELADLAERPDANHPHLDGCGDCQLRLAKLTFAAAALADLGRAPAAARAPRWPGRIALAAAAAALLAITLKIFVPAGEPGPTPAAQDPAADGAHFRGGQVTLRWGRLLPALRDREVRVHRAAAGEIEELLGTTREAAFTDPSPRPNRRYTYRLETLDADGKPEAVSHSFRVSTILAPYILGEFSLCYEEGFRFDSGEVVRGGEADLTLTNLAGGSIQRTFTVPFGGTNGPVGGPFAAPAVGLGPFEDVEILPPDEKLRPRLDMDTRVPASLEVFVLKTRQGGAAKCRLVCVEPDRTWTRIRFWFEYVFVPEGRRFLPTKEEIEAWPVDLDEAGRTRAADLVQRLSSESIEIRDSAAVGLMELGPGALPYLRGRVGELKDEEALRRLSDVIADLTARCVPLELAASAAEPMRRTAAVKKLKALTGSGPRVRRRESQAVLDRLHREGAERTRRRRAALVAALRTLPPLSAEQAAFVKERLAGWSEESAREKIRRDVAAFKAAAAPLVADALGEAGGELIDACVAESSPVVLLDSRPISDLQSSDTCYFSFHTGKHGYQGMVSLGFGNGGDTFDVRMYGGQKNEIIDLGRTDFAAVKAPKAGEPRTGWKDHVEAVEGHVYLEHVDEDDQHFYAKFRVLTIEPGEFVILQWERVE